MELLLQSIFPLGLTKEQHRRMMKPHNRRIVALHSQGQDYSPFHFGRYSTPENLEALHQRAVRICARQERVERLYEGMRKARDYVLGYRDSSSSSSSDSQTTK